MSTSDNYIPEVGGTAVVAIVYPNLERAREVAAALPDLPVQLDDVALAERHRDGRVTLHQTRASLTAPAAARGTLWGAVLGAVLLVPVFGALVGGLGGALVGSMMDVGVDDVFMQQVGSELAPGTAALFFIARRGAADAVLAGLAQFEGNVLQTNLSQDAEHRLRQALEQGQRP